MEMAKAAREATGHGAGEEGEEGDNGGDGRLTSTLTVGGPRWKEVFDRGPGDPSCIIGLRVKKDFEGYGVYEGYVHKYHVPEGYKRYYYQLCYNDGDKEDVSAKEACALVVAARV